MPTFEWTGKNTDFWKENIQVWSDISSKLPQNSKDFINKYLKGLQLPQKWDVLVDTGPMDFKWPIKTQPTDTIKPKDFTDKLISGIDTQCKQEIKDILQNEYLATELEANNLLQCIQWVVGKHTNQKWVEMLLRLGSPDATATNASFFNLVWNVWGKI